jgi:hypothetical protein
MANFIKLKHYSGIELPKVKPSDSATENFLGLLSWAQTALQGKSAVLAVEETGLILLAPKCTQIGDLVCQFSNSDVLALLNLESISFLGDPSIYSYITRGVNFLAADPTVAADICGGRGSFGGERRRRLDLLMEMEEIKAFCRVSNVLNGKHNIPTTDAGTEEVERMAGSAINLMVNKVYQISIYMYFACFSNPGLFYPSLNLGY